MHEPLGSSGEAADFEQTVTISFQLQVERTVCSSAVHQVRLRHDLAVSASDTDVTNISQEQGEPLLIAPSVAPIGEPSVTFTSGLDFGQAGVTASGVSDPVRSANLTVLVSNLDSACGDWALTIQSSALTDADDLPLSGSELRVVAIDGNFLADGGCELTSGCTINTFAAGPDASPENSLTLTVELRLPEQASIGAFQTTLDATLAQTGSSSAPAVPASFADPVDP
jgi:hypothetical protein